ncbi:DUF6503 family protein [Croceivirga thetidis]|uniref:Deoxyribose-phosphate aldolase n=1 Tax=Croceivirga thetidis TaxID=2721623 RepID=A0ABX1GU43_9FLAO|nr:DUF6503 family protein [Croceivirga thetidis]NKI32541.1 deoxyribose-phosphate aldolase [Croceivirga thetidis]
MKVYLTLFVAISIISCKNEVKSVPSAQQFVDEAITVSGGENYKNKQTSFLFRGMRYRYSYESGKPRLEREQQDDDLVIIDILYNNVLKRYVNDSLITVPDSMAVKYANSVNSVHYFSRLPYGLNDQAVRKKFLGEVVIANKTYDKVRITFSEENGGEDFEDVFLYWFNKETQKPDFLAYEYQTEGGGQRFRKAFNERYVNGIRFVDYLNFKPKVKGTNFEKIDSLYVNDGLELLSEIKLEEIEVR